MFQFEGQEKDYLIHLAVVAFNQQYHFDYDPKAFDVISIPPNMYSHSAYEVYTRRTDDYLRLRLYCNIGTRNFVGPYRLYDSMNHGPGYGDEVFVSDTLFDKEFLYAGNNQIRQSAPVLTTDIDLLNILVMANGYEPITLANGEEIALVGN